MSENKNGPFLLLNGWIVLALIAMIILVYLQESFFFYVLAGMATIGVSIHIWLLKRSFSTSIDQTVRFINEHTIAKRDFKTEITVEGNGGIGLINKTFNNMLRLTYDIINGFGDNLEKLNNNTLGLSDCSARMSSGAQEMCQKLETIDKAAQQVMHNISIVANSMANATSNVDTVASSSEEMKSTIHEIANSSNNASGITSGAVAQIEDTSTRVNELGNVAQQIGKVTEVINEISEQTNLLALNATIEAARAGEAGKGFAVVANEIKELARQTAEATLEIKNQIENIQNQTSATVDEITAITKTINEVNEMVSSIAAAVEEQSNMTTEIASNAAEASESIAEAKNKAGTNAGITKGIASDLQDILKLANTVNDSGAEAKQFTGSMERLIKGLMALAKITP